MASAERSMSAGVVCQPDTEMRIAARPRHMVPPSQHVPSRWTASMTARVRASPAVPSASSPEDSKRTRTWLSTTSLRILDAGACREPIGHLTGQRAVALDQVDQPLAPQRPEGGEDREPARPA